MNSADFRKMTEVLFGDVTLSAQYRLPSQDQEYWKRSYVRTAFSMLEGLIFKIKEVLTAAAEAGKLPCDPSELAILREEAYGLRDNGETQVRQRFFPLTANIRFVAKLYARYDESGFTLDTADAGWAAFQEAVRVRHRLTHPKSGADLEISDAE